MVECDANHMNGMYGVISQDPLCHYRIGKTQDEVTVHVVLLLLPLGCACQGKLVTNIAGKISAAPKLIQYVCKAAFLLLVLQISRTWAVHSRATVRAHIYQSSLIFIATDFQINVKRLKKQDILSRWRYGAFVAPNDCHWHSHSHCTLFRKKLPPHVTVGSMQHASTCRGTSIFACSRASHK